MPMAVRTIVVMPMAMVMPVIVVMAVVMIVIHRRLIATGRHVTLSRAQIRPKVAKLALLAFADARR